ncbi:MAG: alpha-galactosidase [Firmicutes bacterium]|nr:alpha-galactosidase [Bacillota bacterium]
MKNRVKFAVIGAGSVSFCPATVTDILLNESFGSLGEAEIYLMDIKADALEVSRAFCEAMAARLNKKPLIQASTDLARAVEGADFVITAIEVDRYHYWSQDFHIPRRYGFRQIYGENGGPGGMFHTLRNLPPMLEIARAVERYSPGAWLINYTNPEAKLVEGLSKLSGVRCVGLCHGDQIGVRQLALFLQMPQERIGTASVGMNHFGWFTRIWDKTTGEDLYPRLREQERKADGLALWDEYALSRLMLRIYGLWPYPGANHIGEYFAWSDAYLASASLQFYFDPASGRPWESKNPPEFVYCLSKDLAGRELFPERGPGGKDPSYTSVFNADSRAAVPSGEYGVLIAEAIFFDKAAEIGAVNMPNRGFAPGLPEGMVLEMPAVADGKGIHPKRCDALPTAVASMIATQGAIHSLLVEAYAEQSRNKLLQAVLLDPTVSGYNNAVAMIDEMCERQKEILPPLYW